MKFTIGQFAVVTSSIDETCAAEWIGKTVTIESLNTNGETGNTEENPLYVCKDENGQTESFWGEELKEETFDIHFHDDNNSNSKGFEESLQYCLDYIKHWNGTNESYFASYKGGTVQVVSNATGDVAHEEGIPSGNTTTVYVVSAPSENHFFEIKEDAQRDYTEGRNAMTDINENPNDIEVWVIQVPVEESENEEFCEKMFQSGHCEDVTEQFEIEE